MSSWFLSHDVVDVLLTWKVFVQYFAILNFKQRELSVFRFSNSE